MNIWVPRTKILEPEFQLPGIGISGRFRITGRLDDGRSRVLAEWQSNLITDYGLNLWGTASVFDRCSLGASNQAPSVLDTALTQFLRQHTSITNSAAGAISSPPYYGFTRQDWVFNPPGTDLNVAEIGMGKGTNGTQLWSRALIKDANGDPLTLSWKANETLTVTYEARCYPWLDDVPHTTVISGVTHTGVIRPSLLGSTTYGAFHNAAHTMSRAGASTSVFSGAIGPATGTPSGSQANTLPTTNAYANESKVATGVSTFGPTVGNFAGGILSFRAIPSTAPYQVSFEPPIMKLSTHTLAFNLTSGVWGRQ